MHHKKATDHVFKKDLPRSNRKPPLNQPEESVGTEEWRWNGLNCFSADRARSQSINHICSLNLGRDGGTELFTPPFGPRSPSPFETRDTLRSRGSERGAAKWAKRWDGCGFQSLSFLLPLYCCPFLFDTTARKTEEGEWGVNSSGDHKESAIHRWITRAN